MILQKSNPARCKKLLRQARNYQCMHCGDDNNTTVAAHITGIVAMQNGKGMGIKPSDATIAFLCSRCHDEYDKRAKHGDRHEIDHDQFILAHFKTFNALFNDGVLKIET